MSAEEFKRILQDFFHNEPLPGPIAQNLMAPSSRNPGKLRHHRPKRLSAVMLLLYPNQGVWHMALIKRNAYQGNHSAQVSLPGGKKEKSDVDLATCALRETSEEIGVSGERNEVLGPLSSLYIPISNFLVHPYVMIRSERPHFKCSDQEVEYLIELPLEVLLKPEYKERIPIHSQGSLITAPIYVYQKDYIWGATAMILSEFAEIIKHLDLLNV